MIRSILLINLLFVSVLSGHHKHEPTGSKNLSAVSSGLFYRFGDSFYHFQTTFKSSYYQAYIFCKVYDYELVSIETPEENHFLYEALHGVFGKGQHNIWTSGTTLVTDTNTFYWLSTGQKVDYASWEVNQPDNSGGDEECLELIYNKKGYSTLVWNDNVCTAANYVICESKSEQCANELDPNCPATPVMSD